MVWVTSPGQRWPRLGVQAGFPEEERGNVLALEGCVGPAWESEGAGPRF